ncbi:hypothetical protein [Priestia sp. TGN 0903]|uniref:hypothetical protein n=1 Tax=Priestia sp. TGN 0903 TaxID=3420730 RepID=UPI003D77B44F
MSKINEIQSKISELNGGEFQKMMDVYFSKIIEGEVYAVGSVLGNNNTRTGTPDTLIKLREGGYIFIEYTVQKNNIFKKFEDDINKCLDEGKTNIALDEINKIICCCTGKLTTDEISNLNTQCATYGISLELITVDALSFKIYNNPSIAKEFLGVSLDTEQILDKEDFVKIYNRNKLSTPLNTTLYAREKEKNLIVESISKNEISILTGKPGVGKTRLAIECIEIFKDKYPEYTVKCLRNNGQNLYEDLKTNFGKPGYYLIFIDDANQLTQLNLVLEYLNMDTERIHIKLILSVREYAERNLIDKLSKFKICTIKVDVLENDVIKTLCCKEYNIHNSIYIERILEIAQGNARIAVMACETAAKQNTLASIGNVIELIEEYYKSIKADFEAELENNNLLKVAAIYSFLNYVNLKYLDNLRVMCEITNLTEDDFLSLTDRLHAMEVVDIYEEEVVKVSDQILGTYLFYHSVFNKKLLAYSLLIKAYFPKITTRIIENINGVFSYFYHEDIYNFVKREIKQVFDEKKASNQEDQKDFMYSFWFAMEIETLVYISQEIDDYPVASSPELVSYDISKNSPHLPKILRTLMNYSQTEYYEEALQLIFKYLLKKPEEFLEVYSALTEGFGFKDFSERQRYALQKSMIDCSIRTYNQEKSMVSKMLLIKLLDFCLSFSFHINEVAGRNTIKYYDLILTGNEDMYEIRKVVWEKLISLYLDCTVNEHVEEILFNFGYENAREIDKKLLRFDFKFISQLLINIEELSLRQSIIFNRINNILLRHDLKLETDLLSKLDSREYKIYNAMSKEFLGINYEQEELEAKQNLINMATNFSLNDFETVFEVCHEINKNNIFKNSLYNMENSILILLENAREEIFVDVIKGYLSTDLRMNVYPMAIIRRLNTILGFEGAENLLTSISYFNQSYWMYCLLVIESEKGVNLKTLKKIYTYFDKPEGKTSGYSRDLEFLQPYLELDSDVYINVIQKILNKNDEVVVRDLRYLFNIYSQINKRIFFIFSKNLNVLKNIYLRLLKVDRNHDPGFTTLKKYIDVDNMIVEEVITFLIMEGDNFSRLSKGGFAFIWQHENYEIIVNKLIKSLEAQQERNNLRVLTVLKSLFTNKETNEMIILERQNSWIKNQICMHFQDENRIVFLFRATAHLSNKKKSEYILDLLKYNRSFDLFIKLPFEQNIYSWSGSEVPFLERRKELFEILLVDLKGIELLRHKKMVQERIEYFNDLIRGTKIREFMEDI